LASKLAADLWELQTRQVLRRGVIDIVALQTKGDLRMLSLLKGLDFQKDLAACW